MPFLRSGGFTPRWSVATAPSLPGFVGHKTPQRSTVEAHIPGMAPRLGRSFGGGASARRAWQVGQTTSSAQPFSASSERDPELTQDLEPPEPVALVRARRALLEASADDRVREVLADVLLGVPLVLGERSRLANEAGFKRRPDSKPQRGKSMRHVGLHQRAGPGRTVRPGPRVGVGAVAEA